jgi:hypothetical protein
MGRLQKDGVSLDMETRLTGSRTPLAIALLSRLLLYRGGVWTCIADDAEDGVRGTGLAQMRRRTARPEYVISFISPTLTAGNGAHATWQRLLAHLCVIAGELGAHRVYAGLPPASEEYQVFRHVGFSAYAEEEIFRWQPGSVPSSPEPLLLRDQRQPDSWGLQRLYAAVTPRLVQNAEGSAQGEWEIGSHQWGVTTSRRGYVWVVGGEIGGAVQIRSRSQGHWIRFLLHPDALEQADGLVAAAVPRVQQTVGQEVFCAVRSYEAGIRMALARYGFRPVGVQTMMVKHCTARVRCLAAAPVRSLDVQAEHTVRIEYIEQNEEEGRAKKERQGSLPA